MKIYSIETGLFKLDGGAMFGVVPKSIWQRSYPADVNNLCTWAMRSLLIEDVDRLILIDTGIGNKQDEKFLNHYHLHGNDSLDSSLKKFGFERNDITDVFLTHLHFDHCGGAIKRRTDGMLIPSFDKATYWSNEDHWNWATEPNDREKASFLKENIQPIKESGQLKFVPHEEGVEFVPGFNIRFVNGHTDAQMLPQLQYKDQTIVFCADLLPSTAHLPIPYVMGYDTRPLQTLVEKKSFLEEAAQKRYVLFFEHDAQTECCTVHRTEKGIRLKENLKLADL